MSTIKELTAPSLVALSKEFSLTSGAFEEVQKDYMSEPLYVAKMINDNGDEIVVICSYPITAKDAMVSDYLLSRWSRYSRKGADGKGELDIDKNVFEVKVSDIFNDMGITDRTEHRIDFMSNLKHIRAVNVVGNTGQVVYDFSIFGGMVYDLETDLLKVEVTKTFIGLFTTAKMRYINVEALHKFNSDYSRELWRLLQAYGQGVDKSTGKGRGVKSIKVSKIEEYLRIQRKNYKIRNQIISRAFKEIKKIVGLEYEYKRKAKSYFQKDFVAVGGRKVDTTVKIIDSSKDEAIEFKREIAPTEVVIQKELELINDETGTYYIKGTGERCYTAVVKIKPQVKINQEQQVGIIKEGLDVNGQEF